MTLKIRIDRKSVDSMTRQITDQLASAISSGALVVGAKLPSERTLAAALGVARNVVRGSYEYLERSGVVQRDGNKGRRVRAAAPKKSKPVKRAAKKR